MSVLRTIALGAAVACAMTSLLAPRGAAAQPRDPAAAEALFRQGRAAAERGDYRTACAKFHESQRLDPALGTLFNIADCEEQLGRIATAWTLFQEVIQRLPPGDDRRPIAVDRAAGLENRLPKLTVALTGEIPPGTHVSRDGVALGAPSLGTALPVDPGTHRLIVSAPGRIDFVQDIALTEGQARTVELSVGPPVRPRTRLGPTGARASTGHAPTLGYVAGGVGIAGIAVGAVSSVLVLDKKSTVDENCDAQKLCNRRGVDAANSGRTFGTIATVGWIAGAIGLGVGAYVVLSSDSERGSHTALVPILGRNAAGLSVRRRF